MNFSKAVSLGVAALVLAGVPLVAQVDRTYDENFQFNKLKTYGYAKVQTSDPLVEPRLTAALDRVLQGYGLHLVNKNPDVRISAIDATTDPGEYAKFYGVLSGFAWKRGWGSGGFTDTSVSLNTIPLGTLVVDIYNPDMKLIWRGTATEPAGSTKKREDAIDKSVNSMFSKFPPKNGKPGAPNQISAPDSPSSSPTSH